MVSFFKGTISAPTRVDNMPAGCKANIQTTADLDVQFWNEADGDWGAAETLQAPGGTVRCPNERVLLTGAADVVISTANT